MKNGWILNQEVQICFDSFVKPLDDWPNVDSSDHRLCGLLAA